MAKRSNYEISVLTQEKSVPQNKVQKTHIKVQTGNTIKTKGLGLV